MLAQSIFLGSASSCSAFDMFLWLYCLSVTFGHFAHGGLVWNIWRGFFGLENSDIWWLYIRFAACFTLLPLWRCQWTTVCLIEDASSGCQIKGHSNKLLFFSFWGRVTLNHSPSLSAEIDPFRSLTLQSRTGHALVSAQVTVFLHLHQLTVRTSEKQPNLQSFQTSHNQKERNKRAERAFKRCHCYWTASVSRNQILQNHKILLLLASLLLAYYKVLF